MRRSVEILAIGSGRFTLYGASTKSEGLSPAQAESAAKLAASGLRPCAIRANVEALTPVSAATCFQVLDRAVTVLSNAR